MRSFDLNGKWILVLDYHIVPDLKESQDRQPSAGQAAFTTAWSIDEEWSTTEPYLQFESQLLAEAYLNEHRTKLENAYLSF